MYFDYLAKIRFFLRSALSLVQNRHGAAHGINRHMELRRQRIRYAFRFIMRARGTIYALYGEEDSTYF